MRWYQFEWPLRVELRDDHDPLLCRKCGQRIARHMIFEGQIFCPKESKRD